MNPNSAMILNSAYRVCTLNSTVVYVSCRGKRIWSRKPLDAPVAKSKLFRVPQKPTLPEDEKAEIRRLFNNYKTNMKSLRQYIFEEAQKQASTGAIALEQLRLEDEQHALLMEENRLENEKTAAQREKRLKEEAEKTRSKVLESLLKKEQLEQSMKEKILAQAQAEEEISATFIRRENIVNAIEVALANPQSFNFAMDLQGHIFRGKETNIDNIPPNELESLSAST